VRLFLLAVERGFDKHSEPHETRVLHFQPHFQGAEIRIEDRADIADARPEDAVGVCVQPDASNLSGHRFVGRCDPLVAFPWLDVHGCGKFPPRERSLDRAVPRDSYPGHELPH